MATNRAVTTGNAAQNEADLRRRNVQSYENANGNQVVKLEAEDRKKVKKQVASPSEFDVDFC